MSKYKPKVILIRATDEFESIVMMNTTYGKVNQDFVTKLETNPKFFNKLKKLLYKVWGTHQTLMEASSVSFVIESISRNAWDDLARHRVLTLNAQSTRNLSMNLKDILSDYYKQFFELKDNWIQDMVFMNDKNDIINDDLSKINLSEEDIKNMNRDELNGLFPLGLNMQCFIKINLRELMYVYNLRSCTKARLEIRLILQELKNQIKKIRPDYVQYLEPKCEFKLFCDETTSCGRKPLKADVIKILEKHKEGN